VTYSNIAPALVSGTEENDQKPQSGQHSSLDILRRHMLATALKWPVALACLICYEQSARYSRLIESEGLGQVVEVWLLSKNE